GISLSFLFINCSLLSVHVPGGYNPNPAGANGKGNVQQTAICGLAQSVKTLLIAAMLQIIQNYKRLIQKNLLCLGRRNAMLDVFLLVPLVPFKAGYPVKWPHEGSLYMIVIYNRTESLASMPIGVVLTFHLLLKPYSPSRSL